MIFKNFVAGSKPFPGFENLPRSFWHELSSPFTEVYKILSDFRSYFKLT